MSHLIREISARLAALYAEQNLELLPDETSLRPCGDAKHGDYQNNACMALGKRMKRNPAELAQSVAALWNSRHRDMAEVSVAGPGFLNFRIEDPLLAKALGGAVQGMAVSPVEKPETVVLDFSSPNVAKSMHVGHIRSTLLGDCLARVLRYLGHRVITDNHIGDWGTQFGKLIVGYRTYGSSEKLEADPIGEMERLYKLAHEASNQDPAVQEAARMELKKLQDGDPENLALWEKFRALSQSAFDRLYSRLGVTFDHVLGESFYNEMLQPVVEELLAAGVARTSEGAVAVFSDGSIPPKEDPFLATNPDKEKREAQPLVDAPFLIRKTDGAALYATTDLATLKYRRDTFHPDAVWYVTDLRQSLHFRQLFATARRWGMDLDLVHIGFGAILGPDKRPLKTREGDPVKLDALLDEAVTRATQLIKDRRADLDEKTKDNIAEVLGIASVKYADLAQNRHLDYVFDWNKMLAFDGNTAPYVLNAYVRIQSIFRRSEEAPDAAYTLGVPTHPKERNILIQLLRWQSTVEQVAQEQRPHYLCFYLFELAGLFHQFFEECPVLKAEPALRQHRLAICRATANTLRKGCELLGIPTLEVM
jgi:arginyl-tRNA synthetase